MWFWRIALILKILTNIANCVGLVISPFTFTAISIIKNRKTGRKHFLTFCENENFDESFHRFCKISSIFRESFPQNLNLIKTGIKYQEKRIYGDIFTAYQRQKELPSVS
jgi:hypothetical protein